MASNSCRLWQSVRRETPDHYVPTLNYAAVPTACDDEIIKTTMASFNRSTAFLSLDVHRSCLGPSFSYCDFDWRKKMMFIPFLHGLLLRNNWYDNGLATVAALFQSRMVRQIYAVYASCAKIRDDSLVGDSPMSCDIPAPMARLQPHLQNSNMKLVSYGWSSRIRSAEGAISFAGASRLGNPSRLICAIGNSRAAVSVRSNGALSASKEKF